MSYVNTQLADHKDDKAPFINWSEINDQPQDVSRFQNRSLSKQRYGAVE